jgi:hypothetical protein
VSRQPDGKILFTATADNTNGSGFESLCRFNADGGEDASFGDAGSKGQAPGIGFWANKNGQALIAKFTSWTPR